VFATAFLRPEDAVAEMRRKHPAMDEARVLRFRPGRHEHFWKGNVVAMGNAYGFVEPLESTALHMLIRQIGLLVRAFPLRLGERGLPAILNRRVNAYWDYLGWFLALHFKFNRKQQTPFWQACRADVDVSRHGALIEAFRARGPLSYDRALAMAFDYPDPLWGADGIDLILLGQQVPCRLPYPVRGRAAWLRWRYLCETIAGAALPQTRVLERIPHNPDLLERFADAFRAAGPAFGVHRV
jgi:tryptophan halogenase